MSNLKGVSVLDLTFASTGQLSKYRYTAPANQKVWVRFRIADKGAVSGSTILAEARRTTTGGTTSGSSISNLNGTDGETFQGSPFTYSVQPNNDGTVLTYGVVKYQETWVSVPILLNGGESIDLWLQASSTSVTAKLVVELEQ